MNLRELIQYFNNLGPNDHIDISQEEVDVIIQALEVLDAINE